MKIWPLLCLFIFMAVPPPASARKADALCKPLRDFVASVKPHESHAFTFHTIWGGNFRNEPERALYAKRCNHNGYEPAKAICAFLVEHGATEFSELNVGRVITCLSRNTRFDEGLSLQRGAFRLNYCTKNRGSIVSIDFFEDEEMGGMRMRVLAEGC